MGALALGSDGLLPAGKHAASVDDVRELFVLSAEHPDVRLRIFRRWRLHHEALSGLIDVQSQWVDGSFVTDKPTPGDIDVVSFVDGPTFDKLPAGTRRLVNELIDGHNTKARWGVDSFVVPVYPVGHAMHTVTVTATQYWFSTWSSVRGKPGVQKGFLEVKA